MLDASCDGAARVFAPRRSGACSRRKFPSSFSRRAEPAFAAVVARDFALRLLTSSAVKRAEHRSGTGGEEAHVSERGELCAVPPSREERRGPMRRSRIGSRPAVLDQPFGCWKGSSFGYFSLHKQRGAFST